jgi:hypothetical protein
MDLRKETIKTEGRKPLLDAFQLVGIIIIITITVIETLTASFTELPSICCIHTHFG